jgi:hypothetical protein
VLVVREFQNVGVSDINRKCTSQIEGAGTASSHDKNGGGHAIDFYRLDGNGLTGADGHALRVIALLDHVMPKGSRVGQSSFSLAWPARSSRRPRVRWNSSFGIRRESVMLLQSTACSLATEP